MKLFKKEANNYTFYGVLFGLLFPLAGTLLEVISHPNGSFIESFIQLQQSSKLLWIIDSVPFWLGLFARLIGSKQDLVNDYYENLESQVEERTNELVSTNLSLMLEIDKRKETEDQLKNSKETAEKASQVKSEFLANMSHEIRTPMNAILMAAKLLMKETISKSQREFSEMIYHSTYSLLTIINDILDYSKLESGKIEIDNISFDLRRVIKDVHTLLKETVRDKNIKFTYMFPEQFPHYLVGDPNRLRQILMNLVGNALKFTHEGFVRINISTTPEKDNQHNITIAVEDSGIGISELQKEKIFKKFSQADGSVSRKFGGTGLGLAISKRLSVLMGGDIQLDSKENIGSTFSVTISLEETTEKFLHPSAEMKNLKRSYNRTVLLVDDNKLNQKVATKVINKLGITVDLANNGEEALEMVGKKEYDLIFMDLQMPIMDGFTATQKIRASTEEYARTPIIAMTANAVEEDRKKCLDMGMNAFVTKPLVIKKIISELDNIF